MSGRRRTAAGRRALSLCPHNPDLTRGLATSPHTPADSWRAGECTWLRDRRDRKALEGTRSFIIYDHFLVTKGLNKTHSHLNGVSGLSVWQLEATTQKTENRGFRRDVTQHTLGGGRRGPHAVTFGAAEHRLTSHGSSGHTAAPCPLRSEHTRGSPAGLSHVGVRVRLWGPWACGAGRGGHIPDGWSCA